MFLVLNSISWSLFIAWFSLFVEILDSMCIVIIKLNFLMRLFFYMTKKSEQKYKYLRSF